MGKHEHTNKTRMKTFVLCSTLVAAAPPAATRLHLWEVFKQQFDTLLTFEEFNTNQDKLIAGEVPTVNCSQCWQINKGASGDCSSIFGCNQELCSFCTNKVSCAVCYQIHQGSKGQPSAV